MSLLLWRLGGVVVFALGVGLIGLALWHYGRGGGGAVTVLFLGGLGVYAGYQMVAKSRA